MNRDFTSNISNTSKRSTYISPLALLIILSGVLLLGSIGLIYIALTTRDWESATLILLGCGMCLSSLYMTFKKLRATDVTQSVIEGKSAKFENEVQPHG